MTKFFYRGAALLTAATNPTTIPYELIQKRTKERISKGLISPYKPKDKSKRAKRRNKAKRNE